MFLASPSRFSLQNKPNLKVGLDFFFFFAPHQKEGLENVSCVYVLCLIVVISF